MRVGSTSRCPVLLARDWSGCKITKVPYTVEDQRRRTGQRRDSTRAPVFLGPDRVAGGEAGSARKSLRVVPEAGQEGICTSVAAQIDTNVLVYRFDNRFARSRKSQRVFFGEVSPMIPFAFRIRRLLGLSQRNASDPWLHNSPIGRRSARSRRIPEAIYGALSKRANPPQCRSGYAAYQLNWFDAHLWSYAEHSGLSEILTEDLQHERLYGTVRVINPFTSLRPTA